jgi:hypothetical protein
MDCCVVIHATVPCRWMTPTRVRPTPDASGREDRNPPGWSRFEAAPRQSHRTASTPRCWSACRRLTHRGLPGHEHHPLPQALHRPKDLQPHATAGTSRCDSHQHTSRRVTNMGASDPMSCQTILRYRSVPAGLANVIDQACRDQCNGSWRGIAPGCAHMQRGWPRGNSERMTYGVSRFSD